MVHLILCSGFSLPIKIGTCILEPLEKWDYQLCGKGQQKVMLKMIVIATKHIFAPFDAVVVCCTICTLLKLDVVWSLIQGLIRKHLQAMYVCIIHLSPVTMFVERKIRCQLHHLTLKARFHVVRIYSN